MLIRYRYSAIFTGVSSADLVANAALSNSGGNPAVGGNNSGASNSSGGGNPSGGNSNINSGDRLWGNRFVVAPTQPDFNMAIWLLRLILDMVSTATPSSKGNNPDVWSKKIYVSVFKVTINSF